MIRKLILAIAILAVAAVPAPALARGGGGHGGFHGGGGFHSGHEFHGGHQCDCPRVYRAPFPCAGLYPCPPSAFPSGPHPPPLHHRFSIPHLPPPLLTRRTLP